MLCYLVQQTKQYAADEGPIPKCPDFMNYVSMIHSMTLPCWDYIDAEMGGASFPCPRMYVKLNMSGNDITN